MNLNTVFCMWECDSEDDAAQIWLSKLLLRHPNVRLQIIECRPQFSCKDILYVEMKAFDTS
jgi:hypothetical protein